MRYRRGRPRKTKRSCRSGAVLLLCGATAIGLPAQTPLTILVSFNDAYGSGPNAFVQSTDENFYRTTAGGGSPFGTVCNYAVATHQNYSLAVKNGTFPGVTTLQAAPRTIRHNNGSSRISHRSRCRG